MKYQWLLFDADGTLFDYDRAEAAALEQTFVAVGQPYRPAYLDTYRKINAAMWLDFERGQITQTELRTRRFSKLQGELGMDAEVGRFSEIYLEYLAAGAYLIEGAEALLQALHGQVGLALITNGLKDVQRPRLARSPLSDFFQVVIISEEVGAAKPARTIFDVAFQQMGDPERSAVLIVGDSLTSDISGGAAYGIDTCWFNPHGRANHHDVRVNYKIGRLEELLPILGAG